MKCKHQGVEALDHRENGVRAFVFTRPGPQSGMVRGIRFQTQLLKEVL